MCEATPEGARGLPPPKAIQEFASCTVMLAGVFARTYDPESTTGITRSIDRLRPLSSTIDVLADIVASSALGLRGYDASTVRVRALERLAKSPHT